MKIWLHFFRTYFYFNFFEQPREFFLLLDFELRDRSYNFPIGVIVVNNTIKNIFFVL